MPESSAVSETAMIAFEPMVFGGLMVVAVVVGALLAWFMSSGSARRRVAGAEKRAAEAALAADRERAMQQTLALEKATLQAAADRVPTLEQQAEELRTELDSANMKLADSSASLEAERRGHAARLEEMRKVSADIEQKFTALATDVLGKNSENFLKLAGERFDRYRTSADQELEARQNAIETLVKPLGEGLSQFQSRMGELEKAREGAYHAVAEQVKNLAEGQNGLRSETGRLVQALRQPKTRGRWGEYQLRNVLDMAGMTEHVDFVEQKTLESDGGGALRPDVILNLPGGKHVVVDAKTPLEGYLAAAEADDDTMRAQHIEAHARQVRQHVAALASQEYWNALPGSPDFVVMFLPGEVFYSAAVEKDPELFERALRDRVLISTPATFIALVKAIAHGWQQQRLADNTQAVADLARDLFERIKVFGNHMSSLGRSLKQAVNHYNNSVGSLERRVLPAARRFETLGVTPAGATIPAISDIDLEPRALSAPELPEDEDTDTGDDFRA